MKFYFSLREGCLCNCSICPSICPFACPPTLPVTSEPLAQFLVNFGRGTVFSCSAANIQVLGKQADGWRRDCARNRGNSVLCLCGQPVVIPIMAFAAFCQASVQSKDSTESERHAADVISDCIVRNRGISWGQ